MKPTLPRFTPSSTRPGYILDGPQHGPVAAEHEDEVYVRWHRPAGRRP